MPDLHDKLPSHRFKDRDTLDNRLERLQRRITKEETLM